MMHTGDEYEARARALRHAELKALVRAVSRFLFSGRNSQETTGTANSGDPDCANDRAVTRDRAA